MNLCIIVQPANNVFYVRRHVQVVVHAAVAKNGALLAARNRSPPAAGQHFSESLSSLGANSVLAPPVIDFRNVGRSSAAFDNSANPIFKLNKSAEVVGRRMIVLQLAPARGLSHYPLRARVAVVPAHVIDKVRADVQHPTHRVPVNRVHAPNGTTSNDFFHFLIVLSVPMLMTDDSLNASSSYYLAYLDRLIHRQRHGFFVRDELSTGIDSSLN